MSSTTRRSAQRQLIISGLVLLFASFTPGLHAQKTTITIQASQPRKPISPDLTGMLFEGLNYASDGGLYSELVQNRAQPIH